MAIYQNALIVWHSGNEPDNTNGVYVERVLWISPELTDVVVIAMSGKTPPLPQWKKYATLQIALDDRDAHILGDDPFSELKRPDDAFPDKQKKLRDARWPIIEALVATADIFDVKKRAKLIAEVESRTGLSNDTIYAYLRNYWQRGQIKNALFDKKRTPKNAQQVTNEQSKRGRPTGRRDQKGDSIGINIDADTLVKLKEGYRKFYMTSTKRNLRKAYRMTLSEFFAISFRYEEGEDGEMVSVPVLPPAERLPTFAQFYFHCHKRRNVVSVIISREGKHEYDLNHRSIEDGLSLNARYPGYEIELDSSPFPFALVSSIDPTDIVGTINVYATTDRFSKLIMGAHTTFDTGTVGDMLAMYNTGSNKVDYCAEFGVKITGSQWPCHHLGKWVFTDRGEFKGQYGADLLNALDLRIDQLPGGRGDCKGIIERLLRLLQDELADLPGSKKNHKFGEKSPLLDGLLNRREFTHLLIRKVIAYNHTANLDPTKMPPDVLRAGIPLHPIDVWNWGLVHRGRPEAPQLKTLRQNLLPRDDARVTMGGIKFRRLFYTCELAETENWFEEARESGERTIPVAFDPRGRRYIYLLPPNSADLITCQLKPAHEMFSTLSYEETERLLRQKDLKAQEDQSAAQAIDAADYAHTNHIIETATRRQRMAMAEKEAALGPQSNAKRLSEVDENRKHELARERDQESWQPEDLGLKKAQPTKQGQTPQAGAHDTGYVPPAKSIEILRKARRENENGGQ